MSFRNSYRSMLGVTLLEIMLVLAIAGMIIVMSVRYYQGASVSSQTNTTIQQILGIIAAEQSASTTGAYQTASVLVTNGLLPANSLNSAWGTTITVTPQAGSLQIGFVSMPAQVCLGIIARLVGPAGATGSRYTVPAGCATVTYT